MKFYSHEKVALVVDGPNFWHVCKGLGIDPDFGKLREYFADRAHLAASLYFTFLDDGDEFNPMRRLVDWLEFNGWTVTTREKTTTVDLAVAVMEMAPHLDHVVIASGDGDFCSLVQALQRQAVRVTILASIKSQGSHCSEDLRRAADQFFEVDDLRQVISRPRKEVAA